MRSKQCTYNGLKFASKAERDRYIYLHTLEQKGVISGLKTQVRYELIPAQYEERETGEYYSRGEKKGQPKTKRVCVEQSVCYYADFEYYKDGEKITEDVKGYSVNKRGMYNSTYNVFSIKRKLMLWLHGIKVREIKKSNRKEMWE